MIDSNKEDGNSDQTAQLYGHQVVREHVAVAPRFEGMPVFETMESMEEDKDTERE